METTDVLILGGGPAGAAAAITLARAGAGCVVLERRRAPVWKIGETLAPEARQVLLALGVWDDFQRDGHVPAPGIRAAWGGEDLADRDFIFNPHGCAWQLDRPRFENRLLDAAAAAGARIFRGCSGQGLRRLATGWEVAGGPERFRARWVLDAAGRGSPALRSVGARRAVLDQLVTLCMLLPAGTKGSPDARTYVEAVRDGWWYSTRLPGARRIFAFQTDADLLPGQDWRDPRWLRRRLGETRHLWPLLPSARTRWAQAPKLTSAQSSRLTTYAGEGWLAAGDAAQSFDPLSGEGLFHALYSGRCAALSLLRELSGSGSGGGLREYAALLESLWRRFLRQRQIIHADETRWPAEPFWRRRAENTAGTFPTGNVPA